MRNFLKKSALLICASLLLFACKDEGGGETVVALDKTKIDMKVGETTTLKVAVIPETEMANLVWSSDNVAVVTVDKGVVTAIDLGEALITVQTGGAYATCKVVVSSTPATAITLDKTEISMVIGGTETLVATVEPEDATDKSVVWTVDQSAVATVNAEGVITAIGEGTAIVTATVGEVSATCTVTVFGAPKIGDYYYEDGTWSDGGLISMDAHGLNPVWKTEKPAPKAGKTVVGIVFQTNQTRIAQTDKAKGYTHGYVIAVKNAYGSEKKTTYWSGDENFSCLKTAKPASTWYNNVNGYAETMTVRDEYGERIDLMPAFDLVLNVFTLKAPESSSGWFLPSTGQIWDLMANLCGGGAASIMKEWQDKSTDATWYCSEKASYDALAFINSMMSKIPAADKEDLLINDKNHQFCSLWASTPYDDEAACIINIGTDGLIELMCDWYNSDCYCRPILAF